MFLNKWNIFLLFFVLMFLLLVRTGNASIQLNTNEEPLITVIPAATPTPTPIAGVPIHLRIPRIGVDAPIEGVGTNYEGTMLVPDDLKNVGWYSQGYRPGEYGNAVIAGHLDSPYGPAIFWLLPNLVAGDEIQVDDDRGKTYAFVVITTRTYEFNAVPIADVFGSSVERRLNLITCVGWFNHQTKNYSHRLIVSALLKE
jgi:LPXTG-site transpeptidase (sortase) family protein